MNTTWLTENRYNANGLDDMWLQCVRTGAESEQLQASLQANHDMTSVYQYDVQGEHGNIHCSSSPCYDPSSEDTSTRFSDALAANQYDAGPDKPCQFPDFTRQDTSRAVIEIAPMSDAPLSHLWDQSWGGMPQTSNSNALGYCVSAGPGVAGQYIQPTYQTVEPIWALHNDDINPGLLQEQVVAVSGDLQPVRYPYGYFRSQGRKIEVNTATGKYECIVCRKPYGTTRSMRKHMIEKHEERKVYQT